MSRWMVNVRGQQFSASGMDELRKLAREGRLGAGDIVQPPGASDWLYALEVPELKGSIRADVADYDPPPAPPKEMSPALKWALAAFLAVGSVGAWAYAYSLSQQIPEPGELELIGKKGLKFTEVLVTAEAGAPLRASDADTAPVTATLPKNTTADLLGKRGDWYRIRSNGAEGYVRITEVVPAYFFDPAAQNKYKPLYYPDQFVSVRNSSWTMLPDNAKRNVTVFNFLIGNDAPYPMTDLKLLALIKDAQGRVLEQKEISVEGVLKGQTDAMVGTIMADPKDPSSVDRVVLDSVFAEEVGRDPKMGERWMDGVEVQQQSTGFTGAEIKLLEVRAIPPDDLELAK